MCFVKILYHENKCNQLSPRLYLDLFNKIQKTVDSFLFLLISSSVSPCRRYVHGRELFREIVRLSQQQTGHWSVVGGNAAVIANRLAIEGCDVLLGGRATPSTLQQFHERVKGNFCSFSHNFLHKKGAKI